MPAPNGPAASIARSSLRRRRGGGERCVEHQRRVAARLLHRRLQRQLQRGAKLAEPLAPHGDARRHRVSAAFRRQPCLDEAAHEPPEIDAEDRARRARRLLAVQRQREGRPAKPLFQPRRDNADHAGRPALARHDDAGAALVEPERRERLRLGLGEHGDLDALALAIEPVEFGGDPGGFGGVGGRQQPRAERGVADAPARVDARADEEAEMIGRRRAAGAGDVEQAPQAPAARAAASPRAREARRRG